MIQDDGMFMQITVIECGRVGTKKVKEEKINSIRN